GGKDVGSLAVFATVDIYDANANSWSLATLSLARFKLAAAATSTMALFAGGDTISGVGVPSAAIDVFDSVTGSWSSSTGTLSVARDLLAGASLGSFQVFFAGGTDGLN